MKILLLITALVATPLSLVAAAGHCGCDCCEGKDMCCCHEEKSGGDAKTVTVRHPLKGVIVNILPQKSALLVKHEEIPGYMKAMTMLFQVDATTLQAAVKGQAITGTLVHKNGEFWLENVKPAQP